ncbi:MAG: hypothetical protein JNK04_23360 [Myxococcales bacterium]|nr:hypothetical protein [Myxococcales bacterium]
MTKRLGFFGLIAVGLAAACDPPVSKTPELPPGDPVVRPLEAPPRPDVVRTFPVDYSTLPYMLTAAVQPNDRSASVAFLSDPGRPEPRTAILEGMVAEIEAEGLRIFTPLSGANVPEVQRLPGASALLCPTDNQNVKPSPSAPRTALPSTQPRRSISWEGIRTKGWARDYVDYVRFEGVLGDGECKALATRAAVVRAKAIVPGLLYGFRTCVPVCDATPSPGEAATPGREEMLVLIGPRAVWAGSSVPWANLQTNPHIGSFSRIVVPLKRGGSASAFINVEAHELNRFVDARLVKPSDKPRNTLPVTQLGVDLSWLESDPAPIGLAMVSAVGQTGVPPGRNPAVDLTYSFDE